MTKDELYSKFSGEWVKSHETFLVSKQSFSDFADYLIKSEIEIYGVEGAILYPDNSVECPVSTVMYYNGRSATRDELLQYFEEVIAEKTELTHFEFVIDFPYSNHIFGQS